ncbi:MAG: HIT domain-containing protein [Chthonomonas sp.]|nr:HIT domain-containing protein [Chthonomonas sp.]
MERLYAPWRMLYLKGESASRVEVPAGGSLFAALAARGNDAEAGIVFRGEHSFVILNAFPYSNGHLMVVPNRITGDIAALNGAELKEINQLVKAAVCWLRLAYNPQGFNVGINIGEASGAGIPNHIHWHIVPRWSGDTNFMTTVGEVRVLPQTLEDTFNLLVKISAQNPPDLS